MSSSKQLTTSIVHTVHYQCNCRIGISLVVFSRNSKTVSIFGGCWCVIVVAAAGFSTTFITITIVIKKIYRIPRFFKSTKAIDDTPPIILNNLFTKISRQYQVSITVFNPLRIPVASKTIFSTDVKHFGRSSIGHSSGSFAREALIINTIE